MCSVVCNKRKNIKRERGVIRVSFVRKSAKLMAKSSSSIAHFILSLGLKRIGGKPENVYTNKRSLTVVVLVVVVVLPVVEDISPTDDPPFCEIFRINLDQFGNNRNLGCPTMIFKAFARLVATLNRFGSLKIVCFASSSPNPSSPFRRRRNSDGPVLATVEIIITLAS